MDKNTIIAIALSTVVIIASYFLLPVVLGTNKKAAAEVETTEVTAENQSENSGVTATEEILSETVFDESTAEIIAEVEEDIVEETSPITINNGVAEVVFSQKGGDIVSYKLINHKDSDTNDAVQISDNVSSINRTCSLVLGATDINSKIIDDVFSYKMENSNTILFTKKFVLNGKQYTLGKRYSFKENEYMFKLDVMIHGEDGTGLNLNGAAYTLRTAPQIGPHYDPKQNRYENRQFIAYNGKKAKKVILGNNQFKRYDKEILWGGIAGKYFIELVVPSDPSIWNAAFYSSKVEVENYGNAQGMFERSAYTGSDISDTYYMYFGPRDEKNLRNYNLSDKNEWGFSGHKLTEALQSSAWLSWLETILKYCLEILHKVIPNWGICIIILTIILKILMFPLSVKQSKGTQKMQEIQPRLQAIQAKYAKDPQKQQQETQKLYQEVGYNPASGCLPLVFQFLVLFAMYNLFNNYFEFRGSMFIPKWIPDLTMGDSVLKFGFTIPLIGNHLRLLPIIYVATQIFSTKITQLTAPAAGNNSMNMKLMTYGMPLMFFFLFYNAPSGLLLYWLTSNLWQIGQQLVINKMMKNKSPAVVDVKAKSGKSKSGKKGK